MSYFGACNDTSFISAIFIIFTAVTLQASMAEAEKPWHEFSNREELVQLAGYGEERLSTVLVTGTVLCEACLHGGTQLIHARPVSAFFSWKFPCFIKLHVSSAVLELLITPLPLQFLDLYLISL
ncbi:hypothetical protein OIU78_020198 [Salix suchowensis]|nr:hypothetical protein OIU78_020198 [Salix suchowensis]